MNLVPSLHDPDELSLCTFARPLPDDRSQRGTSAKSKRAILIEYVKIFFALDVDPSFLPLRAPWAISDPSLRMTKNGSEGFTLSIFCDNPSLNSVVHPNNGCTSSHVLS